MNMIRKLRQKFILIAAGLVVVMVAGSLGLLYAITYVRVNNQIESLLIYISQNSGDISPQDSPQSYGSWLGETDWREDTPDFSYQIRFFTVLTDLRGHVKDVNLKNIAAFTENEAVQYAQTIIADKSSQGFFKKDRASYAYMITKTPNSDTLIVILDCTREITFMRDFMRDSALFGFICILLYVSVLAILSNSAIKPFIRNMKNQKRFITNASHELKTPLAIISANTEALELISGKNQWTENILKQIRRLSNLINSLIMLSKMSEQSRLELTFTNVNLSETANDIGKSFQSVAAEHNKQMQLKIQPDIFIKSDMKYVYELVNILTDNAVKYCDENGSVELSLKREKKNILLSVANDYAEGRDIDYTRFFERFYRGDASHSSEKAGYGIGLSIAEEVAKLLKVSIGVNYADGKIIFTLKF